MKQPAVVVYDSIPVETGHSFYGSKPFPATPRDLVCVGTVQDVKCPKCERQTNHVCLYCGEMVLVWCKCNAVFMIDWHSTGHGRRVWNVRRYLEAGQCSAVLPELELKVTQHGCASLDKDISATT